MAVISATGSSPSGSIASSWSAAVATAYAAYHLRKRSPLPDAVSGVLEDALVLGIGSYLASAHR